MSGSKEALDSEKCIFNENFKGCCLEEETPLSPDKDTFNNNKKKNEIKI